MDYTEILRLVLFMATFFGLAASAWATNSNHSSDAKTPASFTAMKPLKK